jgi:hypothetical protein
LKNSLEKQVLVSVTTYHAGTTPDHAWQGLLAEVAEYKLSQVALFLTGLDHKARAECYSVLRSLRRSQGLSIPFVHARADMQPEEYRWLSEKMGTKIFNLHAPTLDCPHIPLDPVLRRSICIENSGPFRRADLSGFAGVCLDLSHLEDARRRKPLEYLELVEILKEVAVCANHMSAVSDPARVPIQHGQMCFADHHLEAVSELDYAANYPAHYFGQYIALELVNPIGEQLTLAKRVEELIEQPCDQVKLAA